MKTKEDMAIAELQRYCIVEVFLLTTHSRSAQQGYGQLHNIRSSGAEYGDDYAGKGF